MGNKPVRKLPSCPMGPISVRLSCSRSLLKFRRQDPAWLTNKGRLCVHTPSDRQGCGSHSSDGRRRGGQSRQSKTNRINSLLKAETTTNTRRRSLACPLFLGLFTQLEDESMRSYPLCIIYSSFDFPARSGEKYIPSPVSPPASFLAVQAANKAPERDCSPGHV